MGRERHTLIWAFTFIIGAGQWLVNIFKPGDFAVYWMLACSLSVGTVVFGTWGHLVRTSANYSRKILFGSGVIVVAITYYFTAIEPHVGLRQSVYIFHSVFYMLICAYVLTTKSQSSKTAEIGAATIYFLFAIAQAIAAGAALMQGAEANPELFDIYRTINFISLPTGYIGMSLFIVFILASDMAEKANRANNEKSRFMAAASHDLRQPLNSMGLFIYALKQKLDSENHDVMPILSRVETAHKELGELFDGILELSRLDSGSIDVEKQDVFLQSLLAPIATELQQQAHNKGLQFEYQSTEALLYTDPILLTRVLRNIISNAIKYTEHGHIKVLVSQQSDKLQIDIIDTGIGIPESEFEAIFSEYHQIANKRRDRKEGVGLGLSIVKKISDLLDFDITVQSELGKGSCFTLTLDCVDASESIVEADEHNSETAHNFTGLNVLVIDDEQDILVGMEMILSGWGCTVQCASDYQQACQSIAQNKPEVIFSDYRLEDDMTGLDIVASLHAKLGKSIPSALVTAEIDDELLQLAESKGLVVISKPVSPSKLRDFLNMASLN